MKSIAERLLRKLQNGQRKFRAALTKVVRHIKINVYLGKKRIKVFYKNLCEAVRIYVARKSIALYNAFLKSKSRSVDWWNEISKAAITFIGIAFGFFIIFQFKSLDSLGVDGDLFYAIAGIIGTILALTFSLSALPVQKASESFGSIIAHIYRRDHVFHLIFFLLSLFCLSSVLLGIFVSHFNGENDVWLLANEIVFLAASLDLIRIYNDRSTQFLTPQEGIIRLSKMAQNAFVKHHKNIVRYAKLQRAALSNAKRNEIQESDMQKFLYQTAGRNERTLEYYSSDLFEMASRAIISRQSFIVNHALREIGNMAGSYLQIRKETFIVQPAGLMVQTSDANDALRPLFERLKDLGKLSFDENDELSCIYVVRALGGILPHILQVEATIVGRYPHSISWLALGYLETAITDSIKNKFLDAGLEGVRILNRIVENIPAEINRTEFLRNAIEKQGKFMRGFMVSDNAALAEEAIAGMMKILRKALRENLRERHYLWDSVFRELNIIFPAAILIASRQAPLSLNAPMGNAYSGTSTHSFIPLMADELNACVANEEHPHINPYHQFLECSERLRRHLRSISDQYDLGNNPILYDLIGLVGQVSKIFLHALRNPLRDGGRDQNELVRELKWQISFLSNVFYNKNSVDHNNAIEAAQIAAYIGLSAYRLGILDLAKECRDIIQGITRSWARVGMTENRYGNLTDDFFEFLWMFQRAAELDGRTVLIQQVTAQIEGLLAAFTPEQQVIIRERLERGKENINEEIADRNFQSMDLYCPITILRTINEARNGPREER